MSLAVVTTSYKHGHAQDLRAGMSTRAIAPVVGASDRQVRRDIAGGPDVPPDPAGDPTFEPVPDWAAANVRVEGQSPDPRSRRSPGPPHAQAASRE